MKKRMNNDFFIFNFIGLTFAFLILEGIIMRRNSDILSDQLNKPLVIVRQFLIVFGSQYALFSAIRAVTYINPGNAFLYYVLIAYVVYRKIFQPWDFGVSVLYIISCVLLGLQILYFTITCIQVYNTAFYVYFKLIGANKRIINAYIVRFSLKSIREGYIIYLVLITLYLMVPDFFPGLEHDYKPWKVVFPILIILTAWREDEEIIIIKILSIIAWFCIFLDTLLTSVVKRLVCNAKGFAFDTYITVVLFVYVLLDCVDLYLYETGLKEFLKNQNKPKNNSIE